MILLFLFLRHIVVTLEKGGHHAGLVQGDDDDALGEEFHLADQHLAFVED